MSYPAPPGGDGDGPFETWRLELLRRQVGQGWSVAQLADDIAALTESPRPPTETLRAFLKGFHLFPRAAFRHQLRAYMRRLEEQDGSAPV